MALAARARFELRADVREMAGAATDDDGLSTFFSMLLSILSE